MKRLDWLFGKFSRGETELERAMTSTMLFVRSQDQLTLYTPSATGLLMTTFDVFSIFGTEVMEDVYNNGSAIIAQNHDEPALSIIRLRQKYRLTQKELAVKAGVSTAQVQDSENPNTRTPMMTLCKICLAIDIDPKKLSWISFE